MHSKKTSGALVTQTVELNGVRLKVQHSDLTKLPKKIVTPDRPKNDKALQRLANQVVKF